MGVLLLRLGKATCSAFQVHARAMCKLKAIKTCKYVNVGNAVHYEKRKESALSLLLQLMYLHKNKVQFMAVAIEYFSNRVFYRKFHRLIG